MSVSPTDPTPAPRWTRPTLSAAERAEIVAEAEIVTGTSEPTAVQVQDWLDATVALRGFLQAAGEAWVARHGLPDDANPDRPAVRLADDWPCAWSSPDMVTFTYDVHPRDRRAGHQEEVSIPVADLMPQFGQALQVLTGLA